MAAQSFSMWYIFCDYTMSQKIRATAKMDHFFRC